MNFSRDTFGRLVLTTVDGKVHSGVLPIRAFPLSAPDELIVIVDNLGREVASIERLSQLPEPARGFIVAELAEREFLPVIREILSISDGAEPTGWQVLCDRGQVGFTLPAEENVRALPDGGALITDNHGIRFRIPQVSALSAASQKLLRRYI
ncbi:MAG: DUF1854 domain-containing protein [Myxococcota bacterium]